MSGIMTAMGKTRKDRKNASPPKPKSNRGRKKSSVQMEALNVNVPAEVKAMIAAMASEGDRTLTAEVVRALRAWVEAGRSRPPLTPRPDPQAP
jgi:hypothetical protein